MRKIVDEDITRSLDVLANIEPNVVELAVVDFILDSLLNCLSRNVGIGIYSDFFHFSCLVC